MKSIPKTPQLLVSSAAMPVQLTPEQERVLNGLVAAGGFESVSAAPYAAIDGLVVDQIPAHELKAMIEVGREDIRAGRTLTFDQLCAKLAVNKEEL
jgi:hypothetical protein